MTLLMELSVLGIRIHDHLLWVPGAPPSLPRPLCLMHRPSPRPPESPGRPGHRAAPGPGLSSDVRGSAGSRFRSRQSVTVTTLVLTKHMYADVSVTRTRVQHTRPARLFVHPWADLVNMSFSNDGGRLGFHSVSSQLLLSQSQTPVRCGH